jgi:hypothetical protein
VQNDRVQKSKTVCKKCLGEICLNDGAACDNPFRCGGGNCVRNRCTISPVCFNNDCECDKNTELQCSDNTRCVPKGVVPVDSVPLCNNREECQTGYLNEQNKCAKSPDQILNDSMQHKIALGVNTSNILKWSFGLIITACILLILAYLLVPLIIEKIRKERSRRAEELLKEREKTAKLIKDLKAQRQLTDEESELLEESKDRMAALFIQIKDLEKKLLTPFADPWAKGRFVVINPYFGGYKCFYKAGLPLDQYPISSLLHRWVFKKYYNQDIPEGYHVHHKDGEKWNNNPLNLELIPGEEHYRMHRSS